MSDNKTKLSPAARRAKLETQISEAHDWLKGQVYGGRGTVYSSTDTCQICGLERHYFSDWQNGVAAHHTYRLRGEDLSISEAAARGC